jgi:peptide chain release factor 3
MVIDAAKGIEPQTLKLFEVCRLRSVPIITFINKVDREGRDPFELIDEIADQLALDVSPQVWPVGVGGEFAGCYDMANNRLLLDDGGEAGKFGRRVDLSGPADQKLDEIAGADLAGRVRDQMELARAGYASFDIDQYRHGALTPIYFGSALKEFSVDELLRDIGKYAPPPREQRAGDIEIAPSDNSVSGFVFKVQANMDPNHRDRIAFVRLCSGEFKRGMKLKVSRTEKLLAVNAPIFFLAQERNLAEEAVAGDIVGIPNHGALGVGDTLSERDGIRFSGLPDFAPEIIRRVRLDDPMKSKQMKRAMIALAEEGAAQVFTPTLGADFYVGVVGSLQLDVIEERLKAEYGVAAAMETCGYDAVRWLSGEADAVKKFISLNQSAIAHDRYGGPVYLARSAWEAGYAEQKNPDVKFLKTRERV